PFGRFCDRSRVPPLPRRAGMRRIFSVASIAFGLLGGVFFWWVPFGTVASITGLVLGSIDGMIARRRSLTYRLAIAGVLVSLATVALDIVIALFGVQTWTFGGRP